MSTLAQCLKDLKKKADKQKQLDNALRKAVLAQAPNHSTGEQFLVRLAHEAAFWDRRRMAEFFRRVGLLPTVQLPRLPGEQALAEWWRGPAELIRRVKVRRPGEPLDLVVDLIQVSRKEKAHGRKIAQRMMGGGIRPNDNRRVRDEFIEFVALLWRECTGKPMGFARSSYTGRLYGACRVAVAACRRYLLPEEVPSHDQLRRALRAVRRRKGRPYEFMPSQFKVLHLGPKEVLDTLEFEAKQASREVNWPLLVGASRARLPDLIARLRVQGDRHAPAEGIEDPSSCESQEPA